MFYTFDFTVTNFLSKYLVYWTLEKESGVMVLDLKKESYSLANVIACLTGAVLAGKPVAFIVRDDPNRRHILPLLYMVTLINRAG